MPTPEQIIKTHTTFLFRQQRIKEIIDGCNPNDHVHEIWGAHVPGRRGPKFRMFPRKVDAVNSVRQTETKSGAVYFLGGGRWHLFGVWVDGEELYR